MSAERGPAGGPSRGDGSRTAVGGTPVAVDVSGDRRARVVFVVFLAGPVIWFVYFMFVYLVVEAGCTGGGPGLRLFDPPVPAVVTLAATVVAAAACLGCAGWGYRWWRASAHEPAGDLSGGLGGYDRGGELAFAGCLLSSLAFVTVLFVGLPALVLPSC